MTIEQETLLKLLRLSLGNEKDFTLPNAVDWGKVITLSYEQCVAALAVDGLQKIYDNCPGLRLPLDTPKMEAEKYEWFGYTLKEEQRFRNQWMAACELAELYDMNAIKTYVLKGVSIAKYYPKPSHRFCSDFDCLLKAKGQTTWSAFDLGNKLVEKRGIFIDKGHYKHYSFVYKGLNVENHLFCTGIRGKRWLKRFESYLQGLIDLSDDTYFSNSYLIDPPLLFTALFYIQHAQNHFLHGGINLRYLCDWAILHKELKEKRDEFYSVCHEFGFADFADSMTKLSTRYICGKEAEINSREFRLLQDMFRDYPILDGGDGKAFRQQLIKNEIISMWKYRLFSTRPMVVELAQQIWGYLFEKKPEIE